jgi:hypothetical protein
LSRPVEIPTECRAAVIAALVAGRSHRAISAAAKAGELGVPAFTISASHVGNIARAEQDAIDAARPPVQTEPEPEPDDATVRLGALRDEQLAFLERASRELRDAERKEGALAVLGRRKQLIGAIKAAQAMLAQPERTGRDAEDGDLPPAETPKDNTPGLLERLATAANEGHAEPGS